MKYVLIITMHADPAMAPGYDEWGGTHTYMKELLNLFGLKKINCIMVTRKSMPLPDVEQYNEYCTVHRLRNGNAEPMDKTLLQYYHEENISAIQSLIDKYGKPLVIHSVYWNSGRLAIELSRRNGTSFVHSVISNSKGRVFRGAEEPVPERAEYERQIYEKATWIICVSAHEKQDIIDFYGISPNKICVAGQYIHESFLLPAHDANGFPKLSSKISHQAQEKIAAKYNSAYTLKTDELYWMHKVFTYIGRMSFYKGVDHIIAAWHRLYKSQKGHCPALWLVGGSVSEIALVREKAKKEILSLEELERDGKLIWWGYLDAAGLSTILLKSLALITHSRYEPGGRVVVEAMSEGLSVIATKNGFANDYIKNWRNGFLVEFADVDDLYLRMEHFVRQPLLSGALGQNSRQDAKRIIKEWDFFDSHLMAYGLHANEKSEPMEETFYDYFKMRNAQLFPYYNIPLSEDFIKNFFEKITQKPAVDFTLGADSEYTSHIFRVEGHCETLVFKQAFTRLSISPLFNPFGRDKLVRRSDKHFHVELAAYKRFGSEILAGYDAEHHLLALKELIPAENVDFNFVQRCIRYLMEKKNIATDDELDTFYQIIQGNMAEYDEIEEIFRLLEYKLHDFYFEVSGVFSEKLGWAVAPYILEYSRDSIPVDLMPRLKKISLYFATITSLCARSELCGINTDTELKHFMFNENRIEMLDYEKYTIGCIENEVACLLYDFLHKEKPETNNIAHKLSALIPAELDKSKIIVSMAYRCFYDIQVQAVMRLKPLDTEINWLEFLYSFCQNVQKS